MDGKYKTEVKRKETGYPNLAAVKLYSYWVLQDICLLPYFLLVICTPESNLTRLNAHFILLFNNGQPIFNV